jgi:hypothetical protein
VVVDRKVGLQRPASGWQVIEQIHRHILHLSEREGGLVLFVAHRICWMAAISLRISSLFGSPKGTVGQLAGVDVFLFLDKADPAQRGDKKAPVTLFPRCDRGRGDLALSDSEGTRRCEGATYEFE